MGKIFKKYPETVIASLAVLLSLVLVIFYFLGITGFTETINRAITISPAAGTEKTSFDLKGAADLNLNKMPKSK